jgi:hypothetical protein
MLIHCVAFTFKESATPAQIDAFHAALADLPEKIPFRVTSRQGPDLGERPTNADYGLVSEFESVEDFHAYLDHPSHRALPTEAIESYVGVQFIVGG